MIEEAGGRSLHHVYLGLGSNLGDRRHHIQRAISLIDQRVGKVIRQSTTIETEPWGYESDSRFLNGVVLVETGLTPRQLLYVTQQIERELGRDYKGGAYHDRTIDIDILLYDDITLDEPDLKIPHPLMYERDFVMIPLKEISDCSLQVRRLRRETK